MHFTLWCLFRQPGELEDRVVSDGHESTSHYELPAHSESAVTETRCIPRWVDAAGSVLCKSLAEREGK